MPGTVPLRIEERRDVSALSLLLGGAAMLPLVAGGIAVWLSADPRIVTLTLLWGAAVLAFLAGVRRGLSFRTPDGPSFAQIATMMVLFVLAFAALIAPTARIAAWLLAAGFALILVLDPIAARSREVPPSFARLRPVQMLFPLAACLSLAVHPGAHP